MNLKTTLVAAVTAVTLFATAGSAMAAFPAWATGTVNIREDAWLGDNVVGKLYKGEKVWVEDCSYGWCELSDGYFVSADYLTTKKHYPKKKKYVKHYNDYYDADVGVSVGYSSKGGVSFGFSAY